MGKCHDCRRTKSHVLVADLARLPKAHQGLLEYGPLARLMESKYLKYAYVEVFLYRVLYMDSNWLVAKAMAYGNSKPNVTYVGWKVR